MPKPIVTAQSVAGKQNAKNLPKPRQPPQKPKSAEFVVDSEDDEIEKPGPALQRARAETVREKHTNTPATTMAKQAKIPGGSKIQKTSREVESSSSSEESEDESEEDSSDEVNETLQTQHKSVANGVNKPREGTAAAKAADTSTEESSEDDSDSEDDVEVQEGSAAQSNHSNGVGERHPIVNSNGRAVERERSPHTGATNVQYRSGAAEVHVSEPRPVRPFEAPRGFTSVRLAPSSSAVSQLQSAISEGQQIWHIAAPKDVPLSSLKELALQNITNGNSVLSHNNVNYAFSTTASSRRGEEKVLLPSTDGYKPTATIVSRNLCLQQVVKIPHSSNQQSDQLRGSGAASTPYVPTLKRKREQPEGLRQRFLPIGVIETSTHDTEALNGEKLAEAEEQRSEPLIPSSLPNGDAVVQSKTKKDKKRRQDETEEERAARKAAKRAKKEARDADRMKAKKKKRAEHTLEGG